MVDTPSSGPDNYVEPINQQTPSHYEQLVGPEYGKLNFEVGEVVFDMKKNILIILNLPEVKQDTKSEIQELNEEFKQEFIEKLKKLPDYEGSKVQEAIEKGTIEIKKIPDRKAYALYESKNGNLVYITGLDGKGYMNIDHYRTVEMLSDMFKAGYIRQGYSNIKLENGLRKLYNKKGNEIPIFSDEYSTATLNAINLVLDFSDYILEETKKRGITE